MPALAGAINCLGVARVTAPPWLAPTPRPRWPSNGALRRHHLRCSIAAADEKGVHAIGGGFAGQDGISVRDLAAYAGGSGPRGSGRLVIDGLTLRVRRGELHMLLGPNGCGKSTLLRVLAGLAPAVRGVVAVARPVASVFQNPDHQVILPTAGADVAFSLGANRGLPESAVAAAVESALAAVGLESASRRPVATLSGGERQRVAVAGALAQGASVLLLDELTTYLDSGDAASVLAAVTSAVRSPRAAAALWVTHRLEELESADGATYMEGGRAVFSGSGAEVRAYVDRLMRERREFWR